MRVSLENLQAEMVLAADVVGGGGRLLLPNGTALTDKHLRYCQMWGITEAEVIGTEGSEPANDPALDPELVAKVEAALTVRFGPIDRTHPSIAPLFQHCVQLQLKKGG